MNTATILFYNTFFVLWLTVFVPQAVLCQVKPVHVKYEITPHYIKANQPFLLAFINTDNNSLSFNHASEIDTSQFKLIKGPVNNMTEINSINDKMSSSVKCTYTLVPVKSGVFVLNPFSFTMSGKNYYSDSIRIHIYDGRLTAEDSVKKLDELKNGSPAAGNLFEGLFDNQPKTASGNVASCIQFAPKNEVYKVNVGESININYYFTCTNISGMGPDKLKDASVPDFPCPKKLTLIATNKPTFNNSIYIHGTAQVIFAKVFSFTVKASKKGSYTIPPVTALFNGAKYVSAEVKVLAK